MVTDEIAWLLLSDSCKYGTHVDRNQGLTRFFSPFGRRESKQKIQEENLQTRELS